jgi:hypothetical protein
MLYWGSEDAMKLVRTAQAIVLKIFLPEIVTSAGSIVEECRLDEREYSVVGGPCAEL